MAGEQSARLGLPLLHAGQAQKEVTHNEALTMLDMLVQGCAQSADLSAPPVSPLAGQCWIVDSGGSGAWTGKEGAIAGWSGGGWRFATPVRGMRMWISDRGHAFLYDGTEWAAEGARGDGFYVDGQRVAGPRQSAIAEPSGGGVVDAEARAVIAAIIGLLQSHGLMEI